MEAGREELADGDNDAKTCTTQCKVALVERAAISLCVQCRPGNKLIWQAE
jgi:hypothetical protein